jgi:hypothetical protein
MKTLLTKMSLRRKFQPALSTTMTIKMQHINNSGKEEGKKFGYISKKLIDKVSLG